MPSVVTNLAKELMIGAISGSDLKIALLDGVVSADAGTLKDYNSWTDLSAFEITGTGYTSGGVNLSGLSAYSISSTDTAYFNGDSIIWNTVTISSYGYALYRSTSNLVVAIVQFSGNLPKVSISGPFSIAWNNNQILQMIG